MPELQVHPQVLERAAGAVAADVRVATGVADALGPALRSLAAAVPGSRTARVAAEAGDALPAAVRALAAELAVLAGVLGAAAAEYLAVDRHVAAGSERVGRRPA